MMKKCILFIAGLLSLLLNAQLAFCQNISPVYEIDTVATFNTLTPDYDVVLFDGSPWKRKAGTVTPNRGTLIAGPSGFYYERQYVGAVALTWFKSLVVNNDWKPAFDAALTYLSSKATAKKGGVLSVDSDIYYVSGITMKARVTIEGTGRGVCIIKLKNGADTNVVSFPKEAIMAGLRHITIDGNKTNNTKGDGIFIEPALNSDGHNPNQLWDKSINGPSSYSYYQLEDVTVTQSAGDGISIPASSGGGNYAMYFNNVFVEYNNGNGIFNHSSDNLFNNIYAERNGLYGVLEAGANNKWTNVKAIWNALLDKANGGGYRTTGIRNSFIQCEAQDNYSHGFFDTGKDNFFSSCLADGNGYISGSNPLSNHISYGFYMRASINTKFSNCKATNYRDIQTDNAYVQERGYYIDPYCIGIGRPDIQVSYKHNNKSLPENEGQSKNSAEIFSSRTTTTSVNSYTFAAGEPALTPDGLYVDGTDKVVSPRMLDVGKAMSVVVDFTPISTTGSAPQILTSDNNNLNIQYVTTGNNAPYFYFGIKVAGTVQYCQIKHTVVPNRLYRLAMRVKLADSTDRLTARLQAYVSYDSLSYGWTSYGVSTTTVATTATLGYIGNVTINGGITDKFTATYNKILVCSDVIDEITQYVGSSISRYVIQPGAIFCNFKSYVLPTEMWISPGTNLIASAFYRGIRLYQRNGTYADRFLTCIRRVDGTYTWLNEQFSSYYSFGSAPSVGNWDAGQFVWNASPVSTTLANGATQTVLGWQQQNAGVANFKAVYGATSDQFLAGSGAGNPTTAQLASFGKYIVWRNETTQQVGIWWNIGSGSIRAVTPVGGSQIITGNGTNATFTITHDLGYTPTILTISGIPHTNLSATNTTISFTTTTILANNATAVVYWTAK